MELRNKIFYIVVLSKCINRKPKNISPAYILPHEKVWAYMGGAYMGANTFLMKAEN